MAVRGASPLSTYGTINIHTYPRKVGKRKMNSNVEWNPANVPPKPQVPILISFEDREYPEKGYYVDYNNRYVVSATDEYEDDTYAEKFGKVNGWIYLTKCANYVHQKLNGVISHIDPVYNSADIIVFNDDVMQTVIVKEEMVSGLYEGDPVVVEITNGVPTRCFEVTYVEKL